VHALFFMSRVHALAGLRQLQHRAFGAGVLVGCIVPTYALHVHMAAV
jgi:hypothetical protein